MMIRNAVLLLAMTALAACATAPQPVPPPPPAPMPDSGPDHFAAPEFACRGIPPRGPQCRDLPVDVTLPSRANGRPQVNRDCSSVDSGGSVGLTIPDGSVVIFKNGTPLAGGDYLVTGDGSLKQLPAKAVTGARQCFHYMVVDLTTPGRPPLDPVIVIEPQ